MDVVLTFSDLHIPHHNRTSVSAVEKFGLAIKPTHVIWIGDFGDWESISYWNRNNAVKLVESDLEAETKEMNKFLDRQCRMFRYAKKIFIEGNHDHWPLTAIGQYPQFRGYLDVEKVLHLKERGISFVRENIPYRIGKVSWVHGDCFGKSPGKYHASKMVIDYGNVIYGHTHSIQTYTKTSPLNELDKRSAFNIGCLCDLNPSYMRNRPHSWIHAFGLTYVRNNGDFSHYTIPIIRGRFTYGRHTYCGTI